MTTLRDHYLTGTDVLGARRPDMRVVTKTTPGPGPGESTVEREFFFDPLYWKSVIAGLTVAAIVAAGSRLLRALDRA